MSESNYKPHARGANQNISYEVRVLEGYAETYPEEMREPFMWLGGYIPNACNRNLEVLQSRMSELGFDTTASTISKILRGHWQTDAKNQKLPTPVMKLSNFISLVDKLRQEDGLRAMAGKVPFIKTGTWDDISNYIDIRRAPDRICKFGLIIGPTGAQKTACLKHYVVENNHGSCKWIEAPEKPNLGQFVSDLAVAYGASLYHSQTQKKCKIAENVNSRRTIIVDNIQRLYREGDGANQTVFSFLQKLQDTTGCTVILSATVDFKLKFLAGATQGYFEQFEGRCGGKREFLELPMFTPRADIQQIAEAFHLVNADKHLKYLEEIARERGRIRILFNALQNAAQLASAEKTKLTINHVRAAMGEEQEAE
jgi:DNA transposition AAA+ family ATPase